MKHEYAGKKIVVIGLGLQGGGVGVVRYFATRGAHVMVVDTKSASDLESSIATLKIYEGITYFLDDHGDVSEICDGAYMIIKGPSVRWSHPYVKYAQTHGISVCMETALFVKYTTAKVIGVTGTRGKSTTSALIHHVLSKLYKKGKVFLSGNVPGTCALELLDEAKEDDVVVLELSSWQLAGFHTLRISPSIAVYTNLYPDHLNFYPSMQEYAHDKDAIYLYQKPDDVFIDGRIEKHESHHMHNRALAKKACEAVLGTSKMSMIEDMMQTFQNLPYRQEKIAVWGHITVINDSTSTTPIALEVALRSHVDHPVILIMGGNSKNLPLHDLVLALKSPHIKNVYMMPGTLSDELSPHIHCHKEVDFEKLVQHAWKRCVELKEQCYLLFSPGATSFAQFKNEFDRGRRFTETISAIIKQCNAKDFI